MIQFDSICLHNFGSYHDAEINLRNKGFCLVLGENRCKQDNAISNGAGKSFLWTSICFALTGEAINGLKTNLRNINPSDKDSFVTLTFKFDADNYTITRIISPKSDLKIIKNGVDVSGKGIRDSEHILSNLLPDVTKDFIASTIIIGQGMPNKFSSFSPSGRKELLEKLTKADFMIEDLKSRIQTRQEDLKQKLREIEDSILVNSTQHASLMTTLSAITTELNSLVDSSYEKEIAELEVSILELQTNNKSLEASISLCEQQIENLTNELFTKTNEKSAKSLEELTAYNTAVGKVKADKYKIEATMASLQTEIHRLQSITDVCPTCGQKLPDVIKPSTAAQEAELEQAQADLDNCNNLLAEYLRKHNNYCAEINNNYDGMISARQTELAEHKQQLATVKTTFTNNLSQITANTEQLTKLKYDKANLTSYKDNLQLKISKISQEAQQLLNIIELSNAAKTDLLDHLAIVKKMDTLVKRDFRGYLLTNIINYIDAKAKKYCEIVFGTRNLQVYLNGNALDISYCDKMFDNLSGGEKQRVDLILQFAIRDMLNSYLNANSNILVLDEITDFLDKKSCAAVMELLEHELDTTESVFLVSHHAEQLALPVDTEIKIIKTEQGISEVH